MVPPPVIPFPSRPPLLMRRIGILPLPTWDTASVRSQAIPRGKRQLSFPPQRADPAAEERGVHLPAGLDVRLDRSWGPLRNRTLPPSSVSYPPPPWQEAFPLL